ncbi:hypothetical protein K7X08_029355 [Anisodus acutangulus]|uniref:Cytochrome P450 n=1 Tax=Anisodus acutangulus TaxID=402998 RepID=A0A9Q1QST8_9SOLA|nr:hypothetical protein K7X08_029355 [Anisodus acutangulus]
MAQPSEILFLLPFFLLPLIFFLFKVFKSSKIPQLPPGPTPWPVIGNIFHMGKMPHVTLTNYAKTYGPLVSLKLGTQWLVVGSSPPAAIEILKTHDRILSGRHVPNVIPLKRSELDKISIGWTSECNNGWRYLRTLCRTELFSGKVLESQGCLREKKVKELIEFLRSKEGQVVNLGEIVFATVFNMLSNVMISKDMVNLEKETEKDGGIKSLIRGMIEVDSAPNISDFYPILGKFDLQGLRKKSIDLMAKIRSKWEAILEERRNSRESCSSNQKDFLETLLDNGFTNDRIHQLFMELFSADLYPKGIKKMKFDESRNQSSPTAATDSRKFGSVTRVIEDLIAWRMKLVKSCFASDHSLTYEILELEMNSDKGAFKGNQPSTDVIDLDDRQEANSLASGPMIPYACFGPSAGPVVIIDSDDEDTQKETISPSQGIHSEKTPISPFQGMPLNNAVIDFQVKDFMTDFDRSVSLAGEAEIEKDKGVYVGVQDDDEIDDGAEESDEGLTDIWNEMSFALEFSKVHLFDIVFSSTIKTSVMLTLQL